MILIIGVKVVFITPRGRINSHCSVNIRDERHHRKRHCVDLEVPDGVEKRLPKSVHCDMWGRGRIELLHEVAITGVLEKIASVSEVHQDRTRTTAGFREWNASRDLAPVVCENGDLIAIIVEQVKVIEDNGVTIHRVQTIIERAALVQTIVWYGLPTVHLLCTDAPQSQNGKG